jgi:hypothetical protein
MKGVHKNSRYILSILKSNVFSSTFLSIKIEKPLNNQVNSVVRPFLKTIKVFLDKLGFKS